MKIQIPDLSLVVLIGSTSSGKSTFARQHFRPTEVLSSDAFRALVADDENDQSVSKEAFEVLHTVAGKRLTLGKIAVVDATNVQTEARKPLLELAARHHVLPVAIVFDLPERLLMDRHRSRQDRPFGEGVIRQHCQQLKRSVRGLEREGFRRVFILRSEEEVAAAELVREPLWNDRRLESGPFDIIGDIHGCYDELVALLTKLGYCMTEDGAIEPPPGRKAVFLGDLVDRGPAVPAVLKLVMGMVSAGTAYCVAGNHESKFLRKLKGRNVQISHGLAESLEQLEQESPEFTQSLVPFLDGLISHYVFDGGGLVVAHAGLVESMHGRSSGKVRDFCLYGETTGETDEYGLPVRHNWAAGYRGKATVVYGHTPIPEPEWLNRTINIDTGCVFGGRLTALRYPERELVTVPAAKTYSEPIRPLQQLPEPTVPTLTSQQREDELLDLAGVVGKRVIETKWMGNIVIREENAVAALEVMSRFAANPKWIVYLPPTMSPSETSKQAGFLEHPAEAFTYYRSQGVERVVCEEKHMGSRAILIVCRDEEAARRRFGIVGEGSGVCLTRTGRHFFDGKALEQELVERVRLALDKTDFWQELKTDWVVLDCELMPWSAKAQELLRTQYAAVGAAATASFSQVLPLLEQSASREVLPLEDLELQRQRAHLAEGFVAAYRRYCWPVQDIKDLKLAPFHILATEGQVHADKNHLWHMDTIARFCQDPILLATAHKTIEVNDPQSVDTGISWWKELTAQGGEGMVVKPLDFLIRGKKGLIQPAVKCRGQEYLRIIYGPEYTQEANLQRLRSRGLGAKRSLALREFTLGIEALERFVKGESLWRVHECVFGVLALESEPVDPRL
jgi:protein phosphatase